MPGLRTLDQKTFEELYQKVSEHGKLIYQKTDDVFWNRNQKGTPSTFKMGLFLKEQGYQSNFANLDLSKYSFDITRWDHTSVTYNNTKIASFLSKEDRREGMTKLPVKVKKKSALPPNQSLITNYFQPKETANTCTWDPKNALKESHSNKKAKFSEENRL